MTETFDAGTSSHRARGRPLIEQRISLPVLTCLSGAAVVGMAAAVVIAASFDYVLETGATAMIALLSVVAVAWRYLVHLDARDESAIRLERERRGFDRDFFELGRRPSARADRSSLSTSDGPCHGRRSR